ncbi:rab GTPase-activating protein 1-like [Stylophora pistillata]|uniref:Rab GTPase-activating protein 1 n=1 Tax=Stylophora pistillata TaxID=50429 RepID=A0A2B4SKZ1_STYPI|nr:rab GTPase-activating protein 1-like [Stylophora pistillata]XP_022783776.1 rab GTPase-activating protein 1-like [Stylophora pistillata]XP_022783777.1 rab GTPase-activating protein 1-like [Stylophora pistillata]XP_022783778.1 rab GTPase-activating protein 1-like [Stylophora pistillata]PFX29753.1 Rab GTPase-activating protein 1 [Stylophora pistillata]
MAEQKTAESRECGPGESNSSSPEQPRSPDSKSLNSDHEYIMLATPDVESDSGSGVSVCKSQGSSVSSFADVIIPDMEATLEKGRTEEELQHLVEDAKKDFSHSSASVPEVFFSPGSESKSRNAPLPNDNSLAANGNIELIPHENNCQVLNPCVVKDDSQTKDDSIHGDKSNTTQASNVAEVDNEESARPRASTDPGQSDDECDDNAISYDGITYLGSSTVNAPVSEIELKRTMAILREQTEVTIDVLLYVGSTSDKMIRLKDPETQADIATYKIQRILFCGRGDVEGSESDCFAFNTVHGDSEIFHCHVFRCKDPEKAGKILRTFALSFRRHRKRKQQLQQPSVDTPTTITGVSNLVFKFDLTLDILEEDNKGFSSAARDKNCFKLRQDLKKKVSITVQQLTNRHLIIERCFGLLICPGKNVRYSDMHLLSELRMEVGEGGKTYFITGLWDPAVRDLLVLNTETPKDSRLFVTIAVDLVVTGVTEPVRFIVETKAKIFPNGEKFFWSPSKPKFHEVYVMELKEVFDTDTGEKGCEVKSIKTELSYETSKTLTKRQATLNRQTSDDDDEDDEPLLSGSGAVQKECTEEELGSWSDLLNKWKDITIKPRQLPGLVRKGIPDPLRGQVWQMMAGVKENDELIEGYKHFIKKESPTEQVIKWDIHRTFPAHEYFKSTGGEGQETLYKISKAYSVYDEEVGYCQGLSFLSAVLLLHLPEEQAFALLVKIMSDYGLRDIFKHEFEQLHLKFFQLDRMIEDSMPDLHSHFQYNDIETHMYASQWFLTLFTARFPLSMVYCIMDLFLCHGMRVIFQVALGLLKASRRELIQMDFEAILKYFRVSMPKKYLDEDEYKRLITSALSFRVTEKKMKKYEKEYLLKKEQEAQLEDPVERLTRENKRFFEDNLRLEQENDSLAHELVSTKVELHSKLAEAEEKVEELSKALSNATISLVESEDQREKLEVEGSQVKEMYRQTIEQAEEDKKRHITVIEQYKKICKEKEERSEELKEDLRLELLEVKRRIGSCENCSALFSEEGHVSLEAGGIAAFKTSVKLVDSEQCLRELELELAQTKLSLVEAECRSQELEHRLAAIEAATGESKPWFKRISLVKDAGK